MSLLLSSQALDVSKLLDTNLSLLAALPGSKGHAVCVCVRALKSLSLEEKRMRNLYKDRSNW